MALTAAERETIITFNDEDKFIMVNTSQRRVITQLSKNAAAEIIEDNVFDGTRILTIKLPLKAVGFRNPRGVVAKPKTSAAKTTKKRTISAPKCTAKKADGTPCKRIAKKDTGKCPAHS